LLKKKDILGSSWKHESPQSPEYHVENSLRCSKSVAQIDLFSAEANGVNTTPSETARKSSGKVMHTFFLKNRDERIREDTTKQKQNSL